MLSSIETKLKSESLQSQISVILKSAVSFYLQFTSQLQRTTITEDIWNERIGLSACCVIH